jgi:uncharacterized tellurite resistance protein B-like protein
MAIGPIDYTSMQTQVDPFAKFAEGFNIGNAIRQQQLQNQQQEQAVQLQAQYSSDLQSAMQNPTPQNMAAMIAKYPGQKDALGQSFKVLTNDQQKQELNSATQVYSALLKGNYGVAKQQLDNHISAMENSGEDASSLKTLRDTMEQDPTAATAHAGLVISSIMGPDKFMSTFGGLGDEARKEQLQPYNIIQKGAEASLASTSAQNAPLTQDLANQKTAQDIANSQNQQRLAELDTQIKQANSETDRGKLQIERDKLQNEINKTQQKSGGSPQAAQAAMDSATQLNSAVDDILGDQYFKDSLEGNWVGGVGSLGGKVAGWLPGTNRTDFNSKINTLKSNLYMDAIKQLKAAGNGSTGLGAMTEREGDKIESAIATINPDLSPKQLNNALQVVKSTVNKVQSRLTQSGNLPQKGSGFVMTHPVYGTVSEGDVNKLLEQYPGSTREQVIEYLNKTKGAK